MNQKDILLYIYTLRHFHWRVISLKNEFSPPSREYFFPVRTSTYPSVSAQFWGGPSSTPIPSGDLGDVFAKNEDVCVVKFGVFFTIRIVMLYGMMFAGRGALIFVPGPDEVGAVLGGGCDEGERGHYAIGGGDTYD
jgi:hypothetical protein